MTDSVNIENNNQEKNPYYSCLDGYIEYCLKSKKKKNKDNTKEIDIVEKDKVNDQKYQEITDQNSYEEQKKNYQNKYDLMLKEIQNSDINKLEEYVEALKLLYKFKTDLKQEIKSVLVDASSIKLFKKARNSLSDLYPLLVTINEVFPVDDYWELSLKPHAALYGSELNKSKNGSVKKLPLDNNEIIQMLNLFLEKKDFKRFDSWIMAILLFDPELLHNDYKREYTNKRKELKDWIYEQINADSDYKNSVINSLFSKGLLNTLVDSYVNEKSLNKLNIEYIENNKKLEEKIEKDNIDHKERHSKQFSIIQDREAQIDDLKKKINDFERCKQQLTIYMQKYKAQVDINERVTIENENRLSEIQNENNDLKIELYEKEAMIDNLNSSLTALQADYSLRNNELNRLKELDSRKEENSKSVILKELISGINEQFRYLTMFYLELKETGKLEAESVELYYDTLKCIDDVLADLGIKKIGSIDQKVHYDSSIHISTDAKISNGEEVTVMGYGWMVNDEVYIKAPVEKGE